MAVVYHHFLSLYSFVMGVLWFNAFVVLGLVMRKLKFPIKFSVVPLLLLLVLSVLRMFIAVEIPVAAVYLSGTVYPAIVNVLRYEIMPYQLLGFPINVFNAFVIIWVAVAVGLAARYFYDYINKFGSIMHWLGSYERDQRAESLLADIIGADKHFRVYRNGCFSTAAATAFRPYIILPEVDFSDDELRIMLLHEWKHIQDKDYLTGIIINIICFVFWWNPLVYILRRNFRFAQELKSDQFAVADDKDFHHFLHGLIALNKAKKDKAAQQTACEVVNAFIGGDDGLADRLKILALRSESRRKRLLTNICYSAIVITLFISSYMFIILPAFWESPDFDETIEITDIYGGREGVVRVEEIFLVDNGDGTFSFYIDEQFVGNIDESDVLINVIPIRERAAD